MCTVCMYIKYYSELITKGKLFLVFVNLAVLYFATKYCRFVLMPLSVIDSH